MGKGKSAPSPPRTPEPTVTDKGPVEDSPSRLGIDRQNGPLASQPLLAPSSTPTPEKKRQTGMLY